MMVFAGAFVFVMMLARAFMIVIGFHAFDDFLFLRRISERIEEFQHDAVFIFDLFARVVHPPFGFAADINEKITFGNLCDIGNRRLIAVQIDTVVEQQCEIDFRRAVFRYFADPIVYGENIGNDFYRTVRRIFFSGRGNSAPCNERCKNQCRRNLNNIFFHNNFITSFKLFSFYKTA